MRRLTLGYLLFFGRSPIEIIHGAESAGFRSVGLRVEQRLGDESFPYIVTTNSRLLHDIKAAVASSGVSVANVIGRSLAADTTVDQLARLVEVAAELGCSNILVNGQDADEARTIDNVSRLACLALSVGVSVGIEFVTFHRIQNLQQAMRIVAGTKLSNVGLVIDPLHLARSGGQPLDIARIPDNLVLYAQLCDAPRNAPTTLEGLAAESRRGRLDPGQGTLPLVEFVQSLPAACEIELEVANSKDEAIPTLALAKKLAGAATQFSSVNWILGVSL